MRQNIIGASCQRSWAMSGLCDIFKRVGEKMKTPTYLSRPNSAESERLKLSSPESFRFFAAGLQALADYEKRAEPVYARVASFNLEKCVTAYPEDVLPRFYL